MDPDSYLSSFWASIEVSPITWSSAIFLISALFFLGVSAFMSASEIAFFSLSSRDMEKIDSAATPRDTRVSDLLSRSPYLMMEIFIVNNLANMAVIMSGIFFLSEIFDFSRAPGVGYAIEFVLFVFLILLFGEIIPKVYARQNGLKMMRRAVPVLTFLETFLGGVSKLMVRSASYISQRFAHKESSISMDELSHAVEMTHAGTGEEKEMLQEIVRFGDKTAQEIMTARTDLTDVDIHIDFSSLLRVVVETGYSRIPVYDGSQDNIKGIIYIKDLLPFVSRGDDFDWRHLLRPAYFVPEDKMIDDLLEDFRRQKIHMAVVVDEFGGTSGIVTLEDVLEEIVGEISDEYDEDESLYTCIDDRHYIFQAKIPLEDFYEVVHADPEEFHIDDDVETLAGLILFVTEDFPKPLDRVRLGRFSFQILEIDKYRIEKVKLTIEDEDVSQ